MKHYKDLLIKRSNSFLLPDEEAYYGAGMDSSGIDIEDLMPVWSNDPRLPALIRIDHVGDQAIFIYITERDANGEYPIARMERNEFWLAESSRGISL